MRLVLYMKHNFSKEAKCMIKGIYNITVCIDIIKKN